MTDKELIVKIVKLVKIATWKEIRELGINGQIAMKIRKGEPFTFRQATLDRLRKKLKVGRAA